VAKTEMPVKEFCMTTPTIRTILALTVALGAMTWVFAQPRTPSRSLTTQDYIDIQQLYARYNQTIDRRDAEGWAGTFMADGTFNNLAGHGALVGFIKERQGDGARRRHWNNNLLITGTPEGASASVYLLLFDTSVKPPVVATSGRYEDTLVKTSQGWRFKKRVTELDVAMPAP
jgi:SnoaL-like domain